MKRNKFLSIRQLKCHEFHSTFRYIRLEGQSWSDIYLRLGELQADAIARFVKSLSPLFITYMLLSSLGEGRLVSLTVQTFTASIPAAYVAALGGVFLFVSLQYLQVTIMIISIRSNESVRVRLRRFSAHKYGFFHGQDEMALSTPLFLNSFLSERLPTSSVLSAISSFVYGMTLLPILAFSVYLADWLFQLAFLIESNLFERVSAFLGLGAVFATLVYVFLFNLPMPMRKNSFSIRWGFLVHLYPRGPHPVIGRWLKEEDKDKGK